MAACAERVLPTLDVSGTAHEVSTRWNKWKRSFLYYVDGHGISDAKKRKNLLLHYAGVDVQDIYETLPTPAAPADGSTRSDFETAVLQLDSYFAYEPNYAFEKHNFRLLRQESSETTAQFVQSLTQQAKLCNFAQDADHIVDQLVEGVQSASFQRKFLEKKDLKLTDALEIARQFESTEASARGMAPGSVGRVQRDYRQSSSASSSSGGLICASCGIKGHKKGDTVCPACGQKCLRCGKKGHFKRKCTAAEPKQSVKTHQVQDVAVSEPVSEAESFGIGQVSAANAKELFVTVLVDKKPLKMEIDTGAQVSLCPDTVWNVHWKHVPLQQSRLKLSTYSGESLPVLGEANVCVVYGDQCVEERLAVVQGGKHALLGRNWLQKLTLDWPGLFRVNAVSMKPTDFVTEFPSVFQEGLGTVKNHQAVITLKAEATPKCCQARNVPFAIRSAVDMELDRLESEGIIKPVKSAEWASPLVIVDKKNGDIRICADFKVTINPFIEARQHPIPDANELLSRLSGCSVFSTLDLSQAYAQLPLSEDSKKFGVITTQRGLFAYQHLPFGVSSAPAIWQKTMDQILQGVEGVGCFYNDIIISGDSTEQHDQRLRTVLSRFSEHGIRLRKNKCKIRVDQVQYLGFTVSGAGLKTNNDKVEALINAPAPTNVSALKSFLGCVNFYSRFIPNVSSTVSPLNKLLGKDEPWCWSGECEQAFVTVKKLLVAAPILCHYDVNRKLILECDASPYGIGACLLHEFSDGSRKPVYFVSRSLAKAESHYSQIEREALAIVFAVKRLHSYLYGRTFTLRTDHKPLLRIFSEKSGLPATAVSRLHRWAVTLSEYDYVIEHVAGIQNSVADCLSRIPLQLTQPQETAIVNAVTVHARDPTVDLPVSAEDVATVSKQDPDVDRVLQYVVHGGLECLMSR